MDTLTLSQIFRELERLTAKTPATGAAEKLIIETLRKLREDALTTGATVPLEQRAAVTLFAYDRAIEVFLEGRLS